MHHQLRAVPRVELREQPADVRLRGRVRHEELLGDLGVRQAARDGAEHLALALGERVEAGVRLGVAAAPAAATNCSISRRVTFGASSASPSATTRTAASSSSGSVSFSRNPLAPARSASNTYSSRSNVVRMSTRVAAVASSRGDPARRLEAVHLRHADVHEHDVGPLALHERRRPRRRRPPRRRPRCRRPSAAARRTRCAPAPDRRRPRPGSRRRLP